MISSNYEIEASTKMDGPPPRKIERIDCGRVTSVSVEKGGFFSPAVSQVDTTEGSYRVYGDVGSVKTGELASIRNDIFILGVVNERRQYRFVERN